MGFFDFTTWKKLVGNSVGYPTGASFYVQKSITVSVAAGNGLSKNFTSSAGPTSYEDVFDISGHGELEYLAANKPATVNSVKVQLKITIDGTVIDTDIDMTASTASADAGVIFTPLIYDNLGVTTRAAGNKLRFHKSCKVEVKYSGAPGASETCGVQYWYWLT